jgi:hypothetical protein
VGLSVAAVLAVAVGVFVVQALLHRRGAGAWLGLSALSVGAVLATVLEWRVRGHEIAWSPEDEAAMACLVSRTSPLDVVCRGPAGTSDWVPAIAGRAVEPPMAPFALADELAGAGARPCAVTYDSALLCGSR